MADGSSKKPSIPVWQQTYFEDKDKPDETPAAVTSPSPEASPLHTEAAQLLQHESIRNEPEERKRQFLASKGFPKEEIESLLKTAAEEPSELKTIHDSTTTSPQSTRPLSSDREPRTSDTSPSSSPKDAPPIITYPEFLLRPQKPPPLITFQRLLYATYGISAVAATTYATNKYIVEPMLETLSDSRHDFFQTTLSLLEKLNQKLESNVSSVPPLPTPSYTKRRPDDEDETSSIASDPTELFHRDIATQTSLPPTPSLSGASSPAAQPTPTTSTSLQTTATQTSRLQTIRSNLSYLLATEKLPDAPPPPAAPPNNNSNLNNAALANSLNRGADVHSQLTTRLQDLQAYLDSLSFGAAASSRFTPPSFPFPGTSSSNVFSATSDDHYSYSSGSRSMTSSSSGAAFSNSDRKRGGGVGMRAGGAEKTGVEDDEIAKIKQEIRGLKGALLSSRNFPAASAVHTVPVSGTR